MIAIKLLWDHYISRFYGFQGMIFRSPRSGRGHAPQDVGCGKADRLQVFSCSGMVRTAHPRSCVNGYLYGCSVRTTFLQDIGHHGATHPARASWVPGAAKAPTRALISLFYRGHGPLLPPRPCSSVGAGRARDGRRETVAAATGYAGRRSVRGCVPALKHGNSQMLLPQDFPSRGGRPAPPGGRFGAGRVSGEANSPLALSRSAGCGTGKKGQTV